MIEQFDKQLRDHIKDTFDVYDDLMEHDGWLKYQRKVRRKRQLVFLYWSLPGGIAAALVLVWLLNIGTLDNTSNKNDIAMDKPAVVSENITYPEQKIADIKEPKSKNETLNYQNNTSQPALKSTNKIVRKVKNYTAAKTNDDALIEDTNFKNHSIIEETPLTAVIKNAQSNLTAEYSKQEQLNINTFEDQHLIDKTEKKENNGFNNTFSDLIANNYLAKAEEKISDNSNSKRVKLGLDASTFMNFTKDGVNQDMNLGVGVVSEFKISKNFSINSGININKQSTSYNANKQSVASSNKYSAALSSLTPMATPIVNQYSSDAKFVGFDIPLAIKYSSNNKNNLNWFVSTGFSSYTLLTETYSNNISVVNYGINGIQTSNEVIKEEHKDDPFSNLQLARTLNFSVGFQFPIKNLTSLSVEPFVKYPLRSFGKEDLTIGSSGVSLKMNLDKRMFK